MLVAYEYTKALFYRKQAIMAIRRSYLVAGPSVLLLKLEIPLVAHWELVYGVLVAIKLIAIQYQQMPSKSHQ